MEGDRDQGTSADPARAPPPGSRPGAAGILAIAAALVALVALVYAPVRSFGFVNFDDASYVYRNAHVLSGLTRDGVAWALTAFHAANWHPLTWISLMADVELFGADPGWHHLVNVALHAADTVLLLVLVRRATGALWRSAIVAALFAIHPLHVESVAWIAERKDVLSTFFWFAATLAWIEHVRRPSPRRHAIAAVAFALGLLAKPMLVTLPLTLLLLDVWPLGRIRASELASRKALPLVREKLPMFALALASGVVTLVAQSRGGAVASSQAIPLAARLGNAALSYAAYLANAVWPAELVAAYPHPALRAGGISGVRLAASVLLLAGITFAVLRQRRRPYLAVGWFWYVITLLPVIGIVQVGMQGMADRYTYVPLVGIFCAAVWGGAELASSSPARRTALGGIAAIAIAALAVVARAQVSTWNDTFTLFGHAVAVDPENGVAWRSIGSAYYDSGQVASAVPALREAVRLMPYDAEAWTDLGIAYATAAETARAGECFEKALRLAPGNPDVWFNAGIAAAMRGDAATVARAEERLRVLSPELAGRFGRKLRGGGR